MATPRYNPGLNERDKYGVHVADGPKKSHEEADHSYKSIYLERNNDMKLHLTSTYESPICLNIDDS